MSGTEQPPRRRERVSQQAKVGRRGSNIMAGRDVRTTEINNYHGPNSGPRRAIGWKGLTLIFVGVFAVTAASLQLVLWQGSGQAPASPRVQRSATTAASASSSTTPADSGVPPFVTQVSFPGDPLDPIPADMDWAIAMDRELTASEVAGLERISGGDGQAVWEYLRALGGRLVSLDWATGPRMTFRILFLSNRSTSVSIQSMQPVQIACTDSTAKTLINFASEGDDAVPTVKFSLLTPSAPLNAVDSDGAPTGPYFGSHQIDLGDGASPGALDVQATGETGETGKSCSWRFAVGYATAESQSTETVGNGDKPFTLEAAPLHPLQHIEYGVDPAGNVHWADCATVSYCQ